MSTIDKNSSEVVVNKVVLTSWVNLTGGDDGAPHMLTQFADRTIQVAGTFSGGTAIVEGSIDGTNYVTLSDTDGNSLSISTAGMYLIAQVPRYIRPRVTGGTGATSISFHLLARGSAI